jgi:hypothetical protein
MKTAIILASLFVSSFVFAGELTLSANTAVWAAPSSTKSCKAWKSGKQENDIPGKYANFGNLQVTWNDSTKTVKINAVRISLKDNLLPNGEHECVIKGDELQSLGDHWGWTDIDKAPQGQTLTIDTDCRLICGNITVNPDISAVMNGKIEVMATTMDDTGKTEAITAGLPITVDNVEF